jgi:hypothetical protein
MNKDRTFELFYKSLSISKETFGSIAKEIDNEIRHLSVNEVPYLKGRALTKTLEKIQMLKEKKDELKRKFGRGTKAPMPGGEEGHSPYPTNSPLNSDPERNLEGQH